MTFDEEARIRAIESDVARLDADIDKLFGWFRKMSTAHNSLDDDVGQVWQRVMVALETEETGRHAAPGKEAQ